MSRALFSKISLVVLLNLLIKPVSLLLEQVVQDRVGHAAWGTYAALYAFGFLLITLPDMGINQFATKSLASHPERLRSYYPNLFSIKLILVVIYPPVVVALGWWWGYNAAELWLLLLITTVHALMKLMEFFRANLQAMQYFNTDGLFSIADKGLLVPAVALLLLGGWMSVEAFVWSKIVIAIGTTLAGWWLIRRDYGPMPLQMNWPLQRDLLRQSLPFALITILYSVHDSVDRVMLERLLGEHGKAETGLYAGAYRWFDAFQMYLWTVLPIFFARFAHHHQDHAEQEKLLRFGQVLTFVPMSLVAGFMIFQGDKLLFLFGNSTVSEIQKMTDIVKILGIIAWINGIFAIFSTLLTSTGHEHFTNRLTIAAIVVKVILNLIFIPKYGAIAAAWLALLSYIFLSGGYWLYFVRKMQVRPPVRQTAKMLAVSVVAAGAGIGLTYWVVAWWIVLGVWGGIFLGLCLGVGIVPISSVGQWLRERIKLK